MDYCRKRPAVANLKKSRKILVAVRTEVAALAGTVVKMAAGKLSWCWWLLGSSGDGVSVVAVMVAVG